MLQVYFMHTLWNTYDEHVNHIKQAYSLKYKVYRVTAQDVFNLINMF
jgi:hypothetical protein